MASARREPKSKYTAERNIPGAFEGETVTRRRFMTLTANGAAVFLRIGATVVFPDGTWYFPWYETDHKEIVFAVTAGGVTRSITQVFK